MINERLYLEMLQELEDNGFCSAHIDATYARQATIEVIDKQMIQVYQFIREEIEKGNFSVLVEMDSTEEALKAKIALEEYHFKVSWPTDDSATLLVSWEDAK